MEILREVKSGIDYKREKNLITEQLLDSLDLVFLISALEMDFDIEITAQYCDSRYFESVDTVVELIQDLTFLQAVWDSKEHFNNERHGT